MRVCIRRMRELNFQSDNGPVQGTQLFFTHPADGVIGEKTDKLFVKKGFRLPSELAPGKVIDIFCDTKGHVEVIQLAPAAK